MEMPKVGKSSAPEADRGTTFQVSVLRSKHTGQVLFLEVGKDFLDLLRRFLLLPVGSVLHILSKGPAKGKHLGGISGVLESVKDLERSFLNVDKQFLMEPSLEDVSICVSTGLLQRTDTPNSSGGIVLPRVYYRCNRNACTNLSTKSGSPCVPCTSVYSGTYTYGTAMAVLPIDHKVLKAAIARVKAPVEEASSSTGQGFVKESLTYIFINVHKTSSSLNDVFGKK